MKIFNEEKSKKVVYVQRNDLAMLDASSLVVPGSCLITGLVDDSNRYDFVRFEDPRIVEFFKGIDWIVDYKAFRGKSDEFYADAYNLTVAVCGRWSAATIAGISASITSMSLLTKI